VGSAQQCDKGVVKLWGGDGEKTQEKGNPQKKKKKRTTAPASVDRIRGEGGV